MNDKVSKKERLQMLQAQTKETLRRDARWLDITLLLYSDDSAYQPLSNFGRQTICSIEPIGQAGGGELTGSRVMVMAIQYGHDTFGRPRFLTRAGTLLEDAGSSDEYIPAPALYGAPDKRSLQALVTEIEAVQAEISKNLGISEPYCLGNTTHFGLSLKEGTRWPQTPDARSTSSAPYGDTQDVLNVIKALQ